MAKAWRSGATAAAGEEVAGEGILAAEASGAGASSGTELVLGVHL